MLTDTRWEIVKPEHAGNLGRLLYEGFPVPDGKSFFDDFPVWNPATPNPARYQLGAWKESRLVGSASLRFADYLHEGKRFPVAMLGGVVTDHEYQKQGIATGLMERLCAEVDRRGVKATMLWGSESQFYSKFGFVPSGQQWRGSLQSLSTLGKTGQDIREGWSPRIFDFYRDRRDGVQYLSSDFAWVCSHKNVSWISKWENGNPTGFIAIGRGIDLMNLVHEFSGTEQSVLDLLSFVGRAVPRSEHLFHPKHILRYPFLSKIVNPVRETQFLIRKKDQSFPESDVWLTGMDSC